MWKFRNGTKSLIKSSALDLVLDESVGAGHESKLQGLEEMTHIIQAIIDMWRSPDVVSYMYQLLHDNRGGQRSGFSLAVVEETSVPDRNQGKCPAEWKRRRQIMSEYIAPLKDIRFAMKELAALEQISICGTGDRGFG